MHFKGFDIVRQGVKFIFLGDDGRVEVVTEEPIQTEDCAVYLNGSVLVLDWDDHMAQGFTLEDFK